MRLSIITKYPIPTQEGGFETTAFEYVPGETLEQLVSRTLYEATGSWNSKTKSDFKKLVRRHMAGTPRAVIELRVEVEA